MKKKLVEISVYILLIGLLIGLVFAYLNLSRNKRGETGYEIFCDFEKQDEYGNFLTNNKNYKIDASQFSDSCSFSGKKSLCVPTWMAFQNIITLPEIVGQKYFTITYRKRVGSNAFVVVQGKKSKSFYYAAETMSEEIENGWMNFTIKFSTNDDFKDSLQIYIYNRDKQITYIDDFRIIVSEESNYSEYKNEEPLLLYIQESEMKKLKRMRDDALQLGILQTNEDSFVKALVFGDGKMMHAEVRLKGDWLDHLNGDKWSFRIKLNDDSWRGMRVFSIQTPFARGYNNEWLIHKICQDQDVLTTRYDFVPVYLNGQSLGIYSYEEHFQKELIEKNRRREGPIVKFSETDFWYFILNQVQSDIPFEASVIEPFSENKVMSDSIQYNYFLLASNLLNMYREMEASASDIFDVDKTAKFFALINSRNAYHGLQWHNMRYYYNPVLCRLEPIAFDNFSGPGEFTQDIPITPMYGGSTLLKRKNSVVFLSTDSIFTQAYLKYLSYFTAKADYQFFKNQFFKEYSFRDSLLKIEFKPYRLDTLQFSKHEQKLLLYIPAFLDSLAKPGYLNRVQDLKNQPFDAKNIYKIYLYSDKYVKAYKNSATRLFVKLFMPYKIKLIGMGDETKILQNLNVEILPAKNGVISKEIEIPAILENSEYVYFEVPGIDTVFKTNIVPWHAPVNFNPRNEMAANSTNLSKFTDEKAKTITFSGTLSFSNNIYIPAGYTVVFNPGTKINLTNKAAFVSCSVIRMTGTKDKPITIYSSDKTANGFTILQAPGKCLVKNVIFDNLNTLNYKGWLLTGAVNFYECDVEISNTSFTNNHCEDMLNTIRCTFLIEDCLIKNTFGDSHDSDFCKGLVINCKYYQNGNDAIDFSTSEVEIKNCKISGCGDKGISVGENTKATISNVSIDNVNIGIASKDLSHAVVHEVSITNASYGFVLLQKKPEFGPASIDADNCTLKEVVTESLIEKGSVLKLNGKTYNGKKPKLYALFYE